MYNQLINKQTKLSVIGLGYVGLPIALEFAKKIKVVDVISELTDFGADVDVIDPGEGILRGKIKNHTYWSL